MHSKLGQESRWSLLPGRNNFLGNWMRRSQSTRGLHKDIKVHTLDFRKCFILELVMVRTLKDIYKHIANGLFLIETIKFFKEKGYCTAIISSVQLILMRWLYKYFNLAEMQNVHKYNKVCDSTFSKNLNKFCFYFISVRIKFQNVGRRLWK